MSQYVLYRGFLIVRQICLNTVPHGWFGWNLGAALGWQWYSSRDRHRWAHGVDDILLQVTRARIRREGRGYGTKVQIADISREHRIRLMVLFRRWRNQIVVLLLLKLQFPHLEIVELGCESLILLQEIGKRISNRIRIWDHWNLQTLTTSNWWKII